ncbi:Piso0_000536 [Millerozyma farinosa CBS 7064]|uniref:Piso0_000536 protein n=1 Tax=Pichia sorbitophila (strain ATCC MYA-4447 / BCRC 22081 / CBS 7064 / NBRC 10061 / NRRL Y-12695) TaxID=559304 RepID=G8YU90_PICSO|nr:Piso0_000536 [Millerozyma farinosa CBS 7064]CCE73491.1 Piso0_000536 [Millerozyma farinosa CBS 7064]
MESNIDPSITEQDLFGESSGLGVGNSKSGGSLSGNGVDHDGISQMFRLNEYVGVGGRRSFSTTDEHSTAAAALNMIHFNEFDGQGLHTGETHGSYNNDRILALGQQAADEGALGETSTVVSLDPVRVVPYNPSQKTQRLGRPRRNMKNNLTTPENSSSQNLNQAVLSKFRFDRLPLEGPGSRGGRGQARRTPRGRITDGSISRRKQQSLLDNFTSVEKQDNSTPKIKSAKTRSNELFTIITPEEALNKDLKTASDNEIQTNTTESVKTNKREPSDKKAQGFSSQILSDTPTKDVRKPKPSSTKKRKPNQSLTSTSRTTIYRNRPKTSRRIPDSLIPLHYDLYDDNVIEAKQNISSASKEVAFGFPIKQSLSARDIIFIMLFVSKFQNILFDNTVFLGPQDIENGLGLSSDITEHEMSENTSQSEFVISDDMEKLFLNLTRLVLNWQEDITPHSYSSAMNELSTLSEQLGLSKEWKDESQIFDRGAMAESSTHEIIDPNNPENYEEYFCNYGTSNTVRNPLLALSFKSRGLAGISNSLDRLITVRHLMQWALNRSDVIKNVINESVQNQDGLGERDTFYAVRSIIKGIKNVEDLQKESQSKLHKSTDGYSSGEESTSKASNHDTSLPCSNPLNHSLSLRLNHLVIGDLGFGIGRFYFCRMADTEGGGISSVENMKRSWSSHDANRGHSSKFKLYVEDVHFMLVDSLEKWGVEVREDEDEPQLSNKGSNLNFFYEVASNTTELSRFVNHLANKLGLDGEVSDMTIPKTSMIYKPALNMHNYLKSILPLLVIQENTSNNKKKR